MNVPEIVAESVIFFLEVKVKSGSWIIYKMSSWRKMGL